MPRRAPNKRENIRNFRNGWEFIHTAIVGIVHLKLKIHNVDFQSEVQFAIIGLDDMNCCVSLGESLIIKNQNATNFDCQFCIMRTWMEEN